MKDTGRKITLSEAIQLYRKMYPDCGSDTQPEKVDVGAIDWPFPFGKMWRDGRFMLGITTCPVLGSGLAGLVQYIYEKFPDKTDEIDKAISEWDQTEQFSLHMKKYLDV